ncbi:MAG: hypothetical protein WC346_04790 [Methanogenium sp.]|jgi:hypothetical protein
MIINVEKFKKLLQKSTVNYSIETVQINLDKEKICSNMISSANDVIAILKVDNDILPEIKGEIQFNFNDPVSEILPFLNLIEGETVIKVDEEKIVLLTGQQTSKIYFCAPQIVSVFDRSEPKFNFSVFNTINVDNDLSSAFDKVKKIGIKFGKIYFGMDKGKFYIETSDKTNKFSNGFRVNLGEVKYNDMSMCFDYKNIVNLMTVIEGRKFSIEYFYLKEHSLGMIRAFDENNSENYYLMSKKE